MNSSLSEKTLVNICPISSLLHFWLTLLWLLDFLLIFTQANFSVLRIWFQADRAKTQHLTKRQDITSQLAFAGTEHKREWVLWVEQYVSSAFPLWPAPALALFLRIVTAHLKERWGCRADQLGKSLREAHHLVRALCAWAYTSVWLKTGLFLRFITLLTAHKFTCPFFPWVSVHDFLVHYCH